MMMFLLMIMFMFIMLNFIQKKLIQFIYHNFLLIIMFMMMIQFPMNSLNYWIKIYYMISVDFYSMILIYLTLWIFFLMMMIKKNFFLNLLYINNMNIMLLFLLMCFMTFNLILFYMYFEMSLIPVFLLIMGWGFQIDRIQAGFYMMLYTLFGSMPLFFMIIYMYQIFNSLMMDFIELYYMNWYLYFMLIIAFLIKMPMYFLHLWLPKAHVEAPLSGSMILAGVMLKLGSYGLMRFLMMLMNMMINFNKLILLISMIGGIYSSLICLNQIDMKKLVAYSSIVHMSLLLMGMLTLNNWGIMGSVLMMVAHGLCSSGLFCLVNINYERIFSRSLLINKGMINYFPSLSMIWFFLCSSNLSFPPSLNLWSEILLLNSLIIWESKLIIYLMILMFFSACYSLYLYSYSQHGLINMKYYFKNIMMNEFLNLLMHWIPLNMFFIIMYMFI